MQKPGIHTKSKHKIEYVVSFLPYVSTILFRMFLHQRLQNAVLVEESDCGEALWLLDKFERLSAGTVAVEDLQLHAVGGRRCRPIQAPAAVAGSKLKNTVAVVNPRP